MKNKNVGDLPPVRREIAWHRMHHSITLEFSDNPPRRRLTTPWFLTKAGYCRVAYTIVGPVAKKPEDNLPLSRRKAEHILQEITDLVKSLDEEALGKDAVI